MNIFNMVRFIIVVGMAMLHISSAKAYTCNVSTPSTTLTIPNMVISRDAPIGTKIGSTLSTGALNAYSCTNQAPVMQRQTFGVGALGARGTSINGRNIYLLGDSGVGYTVGLTYKDCDGSSGYIDDSTAGIFNLGPDTYSSCGAYTMLPQPMVLTIFLDFYKVGDLKRGSVAAQGVAAAITKIDNSRTYNSAVVRSSAFTLSSQGCSVSSTVISVPMGTINSSEFTGVGSATGDKSFSIPLNCDASTKVGLSVTGGSAGNSSASNGLINLDSSSSSTVASGIKLQILKDGNPIQLGSFIDIGTVASEGVLSIPLTARYYQSGTPITGGVANGSATFTLRYQ
ncbi:hypothetical protein B7453_17805 [Pseudomonas sp. IB20]|uniref:fimbrial protein n=1 Tax=Pseudomonas TaxID=286 RepID=UPI000B9FF5D3|nr:MULTISPECIES: fimbrial protein [unclassified Pseudomonas]MCV2226719.1 fimbrial protein [Pseudomonas sp. AU10]OZO03140.1 hypothetical protein B7453_17805 [Pseudomonas sp. IB20]